MRTQGINLHTAARTRVAMAVVIAIFVLILGFGGVAHAASPPTVTSIEAKSGSTAGGITVAIKGTGFVTTPGSPPTPPNVTIGGEATDVTVLSETELTATTAAGTAGGDEVIVSDENGTSTGGPTYTYVALPSFLTSFGSEIFAGPSESVGGVAVDESSGDVYVVDVGHDAVDKFSATWSHEGQLTGTCASPAMCAGSTIPFSGLSGVAVDNSTTDGHQGYVYVTDGGADAVDVFSPSGAYVGPLGGETTGFAHPSGVAVDGSGNVYVVNEEDNTIDEFNSTLAFQHEYTDGFGGSSTAVGVNFAGTKIYAVSGGGHVNEISNEVVVHEEIAQGTAVAVSPTSGDVYVTEGKGIVVSEPDSGPPLAEIGRFGQGGEIAAGAAVAINGVSHDAYVSDNASPSRVDIFGAGPTCTTRAPATLVTPTSFTVPGTVEPNGTPTTYYFEYGLTNAYGSETEVGGPVTSTSNVTSTLEHLSEPHQTYHYQMVIRYGSAAVPCEPEETLTTQSAPPSLDNESVADTSQTGATLAAAINPNNEETRWRFEYGTSPSLGGDVTVTPGGEIGEPSPFGDRTVTEELTGLQPDTTYYYRLVAENEAALHGGSTSESEGAIQSFLTHPATPTTGVSSGVTQHTATIAGSFNPGGHETRYYFEYGSPSGGGATPIVNAGSGTSIVAAEAALSNLTPLTTYDYRLVVVNGGGVSTGPSGKFTTLSSMPSVITGSASAGTSTATLFGSVDPGDAATGYRFEYGTTMAYGASAPIDNGELAASISREAVSENIEGLQADRTYHYRLVAINSGGEDAGEDHTFTTGAAGEAGTGALPAGVSLTGIAPSAPIASNLANLAVLVPVPSVKAATISKPTKTGPSCEAKGKRIKNAKKREVALKKCEKGKARKKG